LTFVKQAINKENIMDLITFMCIENFSGLKSLDKKFLNILFVQISNNLKQKETSRNDESWVSRI